MEYCTIGTLEYSILFMSSNTSQMLLFLVCKSLIPFSIQTFKFLVLNPTEKCALLSAAVQDFSGCIYSFIINPLYLHLFLSVLAQPKVSQRFNINSCCIHVLVSCTTSGVLVTQEHIEVHFFTTVARKSIKRTS